MLREELHVIVENAGTRVVVDLSGIEFIDSSGLSALISLDPYELMWYPDAVNGTPNVGHYVDSEQWKPQL